ncbi:MAG: molybdopterin-dependent oxidoreductase [Anaerolineales bacterium]|nr:molybdopterin-dependent oxidoreductase [Anaerolineales bacterium]
MLHHGATPRYVDREGWTLRVFRLVGDGENLDVADLMQVRATQTVDIHCVTLGKADTTWTGAPWRESLSPTSDQAEATAVMVHCGQGYTTNIALDVLDDDDTMLAYAWRASRWS